MKFITTILLLSIFFLNLSASEKYRQILIAKTSKKSTLKSVKHRLDLINVKMYVKISNNRYYIYSGIYKDTNSAKYALKRIKRYFASAMMINIPNPKSSIDENFLNDNSESKNTFFVAASVGSHSISTNSDGESGGMSFNLEAGYIYDKKVFLAIGYMDSSTADIALTTIYTSLNYNQNFSKNFDAFAGVLLGYSTLSLPKLDSTASTSPSIGLQVGGSYNIYESMDLYLAYQGFSVDHAMKFNDALSEDLTFSFIHNIQLGVRYRF